MLDALQFEFMRNALAAGLLASIACGVIGTLVVVNRIVFISGGIAHAAFGGIGLAFFLGFSPLFGAIGFAVALGVIMALIAVTRPERADTVVGVLWATGMALGILLLDLASGYNVDLMSYLFGSILAVPGSDLWLMVILNILIIGVVFFFFKEYLALSYDEEFAGLMGVPVRLLTIILYVLIACSVVIVIRVVGLILVIAFFTIGPYIAEKFSRSLKVMMLISVGLNCFFTIVGLIISYQFNITSGASIILVAAFFFFATEILFRIFRMKKTG